MMSAPDRVTGGSDLLPALRQSRWHARQNRLLAALPATDYERLHRALVPVALPLGRVLCDAGCRAEHVYFPVAGLVSLVQELASGSTAEVAVAGSDGLVGITLVMGGEIMTTRAFVRSAGVGYRLRADVLQREFEQCGPLRQILLRYVQSVYEQVARTVVSRANHSVEQRVCRILPSTLDRSGSAELELTQELIAELVGVRRESVTMAAGTLQTACIIRSFRGRITVLDRPALARRAGEFSAIEGEAQHLSAPQRTGQSWSKVVANRARRDLAFGPS
jgi:CRP-like cAMP-binding protein